MSTVKVGIDDKEFELLKIVLASHPDWEPWVVHQFLDALLNPYRPQPKPPGHEKMAWPIEVLNRSPFFTSRLKTILMSEGVCTLGDVMKMREIDLLKMPALGRKSLNDLKECLAMHGLTLKN